MQQMLGCFFQLATLKYELQELRELTSVIH
jgi:hypothetical protein